MNSVIETVAHPVRLREQLIWVRKGATALADQGLLSGSSFVISVFLARQLSAEEYGAYALAFSVFLFISSFHNGLLLEPMSVFGPASYSDRLRSYLGALFRLHFAVCLPM